LFNTSNSLNSKNDTQYKIYQGHHFTSDAQKSDLILPGTTAFEKKGTYINMEGFIQNQPKILNLKTKQRQDSIIFKNLYKFLLKKNNKNFVSLFLIKDILPYLSSNKLKKISNHFIKKERLDLISVFFNSFIKNHFSTTIFEKFSKILVNSKKIIKITNNFKLTK